MMNMQRCGRLSSRPSSMLPARATTGLARGSPPSAPEPLIGFLGRRQRSSRMCQREQHQAGTYLTGRCRDPGAPSPIKATSPITKRTGAGAETLKTAVLPRSGWCDMAPSMTASVGMRSNDPQRERRRPLIRLSAALYTSSQADPRDEGPEPVPNRFAGTRRRSLPNARMIQLRTI